MTAEGRRLEGTAIPDRGVATPLNAASQVFEAYLERISSKYSLDASIPSLFEQLGSLTVMVVGDAIIDEYVYCEPLGQSLKHPIVVHRHLGEERFCGGAISVANQVAQFCKEVHLVTVLGESESQGELIERALRPNVTAKFFTRPDAPTVIKKRYVYENVEHKLFEICYINDFLMADTLEAEVRSYIGQASPAFDMVMISDYGHGALTELIASEVRESCRFLAVNAQTNSANLGYNLITKKYHTPDYAIVDEAEARLAMQDKHDNLDSVGRRLAASLDSGRLIITRGRHGSVGFERGSDEVCKAPALARRVVDRVGAGDMFFALSAPCSALEMPLDLVSFLGNAVGALAVQIVGNRETVTADTLRDFVASLVP